MNKINFKMTQEEKQAINYLAGRQSHLNFFSIRVELRTREVAQGYPFNWSITSYNIAVFNQKDDDEGAYEATIGIESLMDSIEAIQTPEGYRCELMLRVCDKLGIDSYAWLYVTFEGKDEESMQMTSICEYGDRGFMLWDCERGFNVPA